MFMVSLTVYWLQDLPLFVTGLWCHCPFVVQQTVLPAQRARRHQPRSDRQRWRHLRRRQRGRGGRGARPQGLQRGLIFVNLLSIIR